MALNVFSILNVAIWGKEGVIRGLWRDGESIWRGFLGIFAEVLETHDTGFFNYVQFYYYTCGLHFLSSILSYLLLLNCDYFHYVNSQVEFRKVKRIYWDDCKGVRRDKRGEGIIMDLGSCLKKYLRKNELNEEEVIDRRELGSMVRAGSPWGESGVWDRGIGSNCLLFWLPNISMGIGWLAYHLDS